MPSIIEALEAQGFADSNTGGGCRAMCRLIGSCEVLVTAGSDGGTLPESDDWMIGAYDDDGNQVALFDHSQGIPLERAIAGAIEAAETADRKGK